MQIDVYSQIGFVMLIGLAAKNAILIVEFARRRREEGLSIVDAASEAGRLRLAADPDDGVRLHPRRRAADDRDAARARRAGSRIGTTVFGGMLAATVLTLIFVPVFYAVIEGCARARTGAADQDDADPPSRMAH